MNLTITTFPNRKSPKGKELSLSWEELKDKLKNPVITDESIGEYFAFTNEQRTDIKDVGGFVGGAFKDHRRAKDRLLYRSVLCIDADDASLNDVDDFTLLYNPVFCCHTTHSHTDEKPRLRWVFPLARNVNAAEYRYIANTVAEWVGANSIDETTDQPERLMFWPSQAFDGEWHFWEGGADILDPDELLAGVELETTAPVKEKPEPRESEEGLVVPEGQRNRTVFEFAATLRNKGLDMAGIRSMIEDYSDRYCSPPLDDAELDTIARSVCGRYKPGEAVTSLRTAWDDFHDLGEWKEKKKEQAKLRWESASELDERDVSPPDYVVPGLLANGINIIASPPKFGKSWMMMDLAISVATGTDFIGMSVEQTGVIYMALEDGDSRLKDRMRKVAGSRPRPDNLYFVQEAPGLGDDLLQQLDAMIKATPRRIGLVIIDTLQKVRGVAGKTEGVYGYDYRELGKLKSFFDDHHICGVLVHHLNKGGDDNDFVGRLNGSTGVSGAADTIITLTRGKRGDLETKMSITGRDVNERTLVIQMDWSSFRWICLGDERDVERDHDQYAFQSDPLVKTILWHLDEAEELAEESAEKVSWSCTSADLLASVVALYGPQESDSATAMGMKVKKLAPQLEAQAGVTYEYSRANARREHVFTREIL